MFRWRRSPDPEAELRELVGDYELPTFSAGAVETMRLLREDADMRIIGERLMADPGLSVGILRTVNSAAFGLRNQVSDLTQAATLLGRSRVEALVLTAAVGDSLPTSNAFDLESFWHASARRACLARHLAASVDAGSQMVAFTAGLLQDMAVPVMAASMGDRYTTIFAEAAGSDAPEELRRLEAEELGYDHARLGAVMAERWELPEALITAIADHHLPGERAPDPVEAVAHVGYRPDDPACDSLADFRTHCRDALGLEEERLEALIGVAVAESASLAQGMGAAA